MIEREYHTYLKLERGLSNNSIAAYELDFKRLKTYMEDKLEIPVHIAKQPEFCAVTGLKNIIESKDLMKMAYSTTFKREILQWQQMQTMMTMMMTICSK